MTRTKSLGYHRLLRLPRSGRRTRSSPSSSIRTRSRMRPFAKRAPPSSRRYRRPTSSYPMRTSVRSMTRRNGLPPLPGREWRRLEVRPDRQSQEKTASLKTSRPEDTRQHQNTNHDRRRRLLLLPRQSLVELLEIPLQCQ